MEMLEHFVTELSVQHLETRPNRLLSDAGLVGEGVGSRATMEVRVHAVFDDRVTGSVPVSTNFKG